MTIDQSRKSINPLLRIILAIFLPVFFLFGIGSLLQRRFKTAAILFLSGIGVFFYWLDRYKQTMVGIGMDDQNSGLLQWLGVSHPDVIVVPLLWVAPFVVLWAVNNYLFLRDELMSSRFDSMSALKLKRMVMWIAVFGIPILSLIIPINSKLYEPFGIHGVAWPGGYNLELGLFVGAFFLLSVVLIVLLSMLVYHDQWHPRRSRRLADSPVLLNTAGAAIGVLGTGFLVGRRKTWFPMFCFLGLSMILALVLLFRGEAVWELLGVYGWFNLYAFGIHVHLVPVAGYLLFWGLSIQLLQPEPAESWNNTLELEQP